MAECQPFKSSSGGKQQLTPWMGIHGRMSAIQIKLRRQTATHLLDGNSRQNVSHSNQAQEEKATHSLDGNSWQNVSHSNQAQEANSNPLPGWKFMAECQPFKS